MKYVVRLLGAISVLTLIMVPAALSASGPQGSSEPVQAGSPDSLSSPLAEKQDALLQAGLEAKLAGSIAESKHVAKIGKKYVELTRTGEDSILTVLGEFGTATNSAHHGHSGGLAGPLHNTIPQPNRAVDNTTIWAPDFSQAYYENLLFNDTPGANSMRRYYIEQSSNRYTVNGAVTNWALVPYNTRSYGSNYCGSIVCQDTWRFVNDSADAWGGTMSTADLNAYLAQFDVWDRYDYDGDSDFNEPDGYIDHYQSIHAGAGEEVGGGAYGTDAIWSHRWYAYFSANGPDGVGPHGFGGVKIGTSNYWIGDYTIEPENGGVGVFAHEFAHDLGLPDEYDTSGNVGGAENSTAWWTLMSQGSYGTQSEDLGSAPTHMNAWDKFQLGWLNYDVVFPGQKKTELKLGPAEYNTKDAQGVFVVLPDKEVTTNLGAPYAGSKFYYSGTGDNLDTSMTRSISLPAGVVTLSAQVRYNIEQDWDYAYLTVNGTPVLTDRSTATNPNSQNFGNGITGLQTTWGALNADLSAYAGTTVTIGLRYWTDGAAQGNGGATPPGFQIDDISITGQPTDGAETPAGWTFSPSDGSGFRETTGTESQFFGNYYLAESRNYVGYDRSLLLGPYQFGFLDNPALQNYVEHFSNDYGMLLWYWDTSYGDNNVGDHPGAGLILPVDGRPTPRHWSDGWLMRPRLQAFDSTFSKHKTVAFTLHKSSVATAIPAQPANPEFDDMNTYWFATDGHAHGVGGDRYMVGWNSVNVPHTGTSIKVKSENKDGFMHIEVKPAP